MRRTPQLVSRINLGAPLPRGRERTQQLVRRRSGAAGDGVVRVRGGASRHVSSKALTSRTGEHHRQQQQQQQHGRNQKIVSGVAGRRWMSAHESVSEQVQEQDLPTDDRTWLGLFLLVSFSRNGYSVPVHTAGVLVFTTPIWIAPAPAGLEDRRVSQVSCFTRAVPQS